MSISNIDKIREKLEKIKKLADDMYYAAANLGPNVGSGERLRKTMEEYYKFIIHEYNKEEPKFKVGDTIELITDGFRVEVCQVLDDKYICDSGGTMIVVHKDNQEQWKLVEECNITGIKSRHATGKLKECIDNQTEEGLDKARKQLEENPQECMYARDNYTDEDRKVLCDGCKEKCEYAQKEADWLQELHCKLDSLSKEDFEKVWAKYHQKEEPVSDDLDEAAKMYSMFERSDDTEVGYDLNRYGGFIAGAQWQKEQFEKNRLKRCNSITEEQYNLEVGFIDQHLDKYQCMPTYLDAIEYGMQFKEQQMVKDAVEGVITFDYYKDDKAYGCVAHDSFCLEERGLRDCDNVKMIVVKEG